MIKFGRVGEDGRWMIGLGLTVENLTRITGRLEPVAFPAEQVGLDGTLAICTPGMGAALATQIARVHCLELAPADAVALNGGACVERSLASLGYDRDGVALLFLGQTEADIFEQLQAAGLVTDTAQVLYRRKRERPKPERTIKPKLILAGALLSGCGLGGEMLKNPGLGVLLTILGIATIIWGCTYRSYR